MTGKYDSGKGTATHLLQDYFRLVAQESGIEWDRRNDSEVAQIMDALQQSARQQAVDIIAKAMFAADAMTQEEAQAALAEEEALRVVQLHTHTVKCGACLQEIETLFWHMDTNTPMATACPGCGVQWESFQTVAIPVYPAPTSDSLRVMFPEEED